MEVHKEKLERIRCRFRQLHFVAVFLIRASLFQFAVCLIISAPHTTLLLQSVDTATKPKSVTLKFFIHIHVLTHLTLQLHSPLRQFPVQIEPVLSPNCDGSRGGFSSGKAGQEEEAAEG